MQPEKVDETAKKLQSEQWKCFTEFPFSQRTLNCFSSAEICSVERLTKMTAQQMQKFRNIGRSGMMEIRLALARINLSLQGEPIYNPPEPSETDSLKSRLGILEQKRDEILVRIQQLKSQIMAQRPLKRKPPKNPERDYQLFARWKQVRDYEVVAHEFGVSSKKVRSVVQNRAAQRQ